MDSFAMFEQADDFILGREDEYDAYDHPFYPPVDVFEDDDPSDFGFDPYVGDYVDDEPADPYDFTAAFDNEY